MYCLCIACVLYIVSKSLGRDNSELYKLRVSWICMVVHRSATKTVRVFDNSALIHLDLDLVFFFFFSLFGPVGPCDTLPSVHPVLSEL